MALRIQGALAVPLGPLAICLNSEGLVELPTQTEMLPAFELFHDTVLVHVPAGFGRVHRDAEMDPSSGLLAER